MLNVDPSNLVFLKIYYTGFDEIIITFTDQNNRLLEIEDKVYLTLFINKKMMRYSIERRIRKYVKEYRFLSFRKKILKAIIG